MKNFLLLAAFAIGATAFILSCDMDEEETSARESTATSEIGQFGGHAKGKRVSSIDEYTFVYADNGKLAKVISYNSNQLYKISYNPFIIEKTKLSPESYYVKLFDFAFTPEGYVKSYCVEGKANYDEENFSYDYTERRDITYDLDGRISRVVYSEYYCDRETHTGKVDIYNTTGTRTVSWENGNLVKVEKDEICDVEKTKDDGTTKSYRRFDTWTKKCQTGNELNIYGQNTIESGTIINVGEGDGLLAVLGMLGKGSTHYITKCAEEYAEGKVDGEKYSGSYVYTYTYETDEDGYVVYDSYNGKYVYE